MHKIETLVSCEEIDRAWLQIADHVHRTPLGQSSYFSQRIGTPIYLKQELFQKTGSFKVRGVLNKLQSLPADASEKGVITLSAGNHAQAVAWAATQSAIPATVVMPANSVVSKQMATREYGGEVILTEDNLLATCLEIQAERGAYLVHPFDDRLIIAGHGTVGNEILQDVPDVDVVVVGVGGGGLIAGVAAAIKQVRPKVRIIGVEPEGAAAMTKSLAKGEPVHLDKVDTIADGLAAPFVGEHNLRHVQAFVDQVVLVREDDIRVALRMIWERTKLLAEPAAATTLAALLTEKVSFQPGEKVCCILCGGNVDLDNLPSLGFG